MNKLERLQDRAMHSQIKAALKEYRVSKSWNQATMADFLRITKENYQKYELDNERGPYVKVPVVVFMRFCAQTQQNPLDLVFPRSRRAAG